MFPIVFAAAWPAVDTARAGGSFTTSGDFVALIVASLNVTATQATDRHDPSPAPPPALRYCALVLTVS